MRIILKDFSTNVEILNRTVIRVSFNDNRIAIMLEGKERLETPPKAQTLYKIQIDDGVCEREYFVEFLSYNYIIMSNNYTNEEGKQVSELAISDNTLLFKQF
jgi:hypothetical protein